jgi:hypothetical protein
MPKLGSAATKVIITVDLMVRENDSNIRFLMPHYLHK